MEFYAARTARGAVFLARSGEECISAGDGYLRGRHGPYELFAARKGRGFVLEKTAGKRTEEIASYPEGSGLLGGLEEVLLKLYDGRGTDGLQFGFLDKYGAKALYAPGTRFFNSPKDYRAHDKKLSRVNNEFYRVLALSLAEAKQADGQKDTGLFSRVASSVGRKRCLSELRDIITRYMDYSHGPLERYTVGRFLQSYRAEPKKPRRKERSRQEELDREFLPKDRKSLMLRLNEKGADYQEQVYGLAKDIASPVVSLVSLPVLIVDGEPREIDRLYSQLSAGRFFRFGASRDTLSMARSVQYSHGVYIPEIISGFRMKHRKQADMWNLDMIGAPEANKATRGRGGLVAVVDTGVDYTHNELSQAFTKNLGYNFVNSSNDPMDGNGHGTHVAGTIAGTHTGVAGEATLYAVKVLADNGTGYLSDVLQGLDWCIVNKVHVANFSLGSPSPSDIAEELFGLAAKRGVVCVAAAGNEGYGPSYPASYESVVAVPAVDREKRHAYFSNIYYTNNVCAPGVDILSTVPGNSHAEYSGTSMAAPHVSGAAALMAALGQIDLFRDVVEKTAEELGDRDTFGAGLLRADRLVEE